MDVLLRACLAKVLPRWWAHKCVRVCIVCWGGGSFAWFFVRTWFLFVFVFIWVYYCITLVMCVSACAPAGVAAHKCVECAGGLECMVLVRVWSASAGAAGHVGWSIVDHIVVVCCVC